jgi:hypothetical protein
MLPRLQAEEQLVAVDANALGTGSYDQGDARRMMSRLRDTAFGERRSRGRAANPVQLASMGIGVTMMPPKTALSDG